MKTEIFKVLVSGLLLFTCAQARAQTTPADTSLRWQQGFFDIHHINTGRGNSTFFIFPDGTTMLLDAGDLNAAYFMRRSAPLQVAPARPNDSQSAGQWIAEYIQQAMPRGRQPELDYLVVSHFHGDHYGDLTDRANLSSASTFQRTGITEVGDLMPVRTLIDRGYPAYDFPVNLRKFYAGERSTFLNYLAFMEAKRKQGMNAEMLQAGSNRQIGLRRQPSGFQNFTIRNIKVNGTIWSGTGEDTFTHVSADSVMFNQKSFNENPLSMALRFSYGPFDYFTGADNTG